MLPSSSPVKDASLSVQPLSFQRKVLYETAKENSGFYKPTKHKSDFIEESWWREFKQSETSFASFLVRKSRREH